MLLVLSQNVAKIHHLVAPVGLLDYDKSKKIAFVIQIHNFEFQFMKEKNISFESKSSFYLPTEI